MYKFYKSRCVLLLISDKSDYLIQTPITDFIGAFATFNFSS